MGNATNIKLDVIRGEDRYERRRKSSFLDYCPYPLAPF